MAEPKTKVTNASVEDFISAVKDEQIREDCFAVAKIMQEATKNEPKMWGASIVGFGLYTYKYASGQTGDWPLVGFSPRKQNLTLYVMGGFDEYDDLMDKLGKFTCGKSCIYIKRLSDLHLPTLKKLIKASVKHMLKTHPPNKK
ncbi:MAG TPA: DUF1801 domain-containing protein [Blastocatellia bacterium]|nr:DUF1801 domain-containing protein [Blastocatellia bacterium]